MGGDSSHLRSLDKRAGSLKHGILGPSHLIGLLPVEQNSEGRKMSSQLGRMLAIAILLATAPGYAAARADEPVRLKQATPLAKGVAAFPHLVGGASRSAVARINRALTAAEQGVGCVDQNAPNTDWSRSIFATMRGPRYLSLLAHDDFYCGGPYPDTDQIALVFDLRTGAPINWKRLFPAGFIDAAGPSPGGGDSQPITVSSSALWKLYAQTATADLKNKDCAEVLANPSGVGTGLMLWPDAKTDGLSIQQADFPHVVKACGPAETIQRYDLAKLGISSAFLAALDEAHRRRWYDKSAK